MAGNLVADEKVLVSFSKQEILVFEDAISALAWLGAPGNEIGLIDYMGTEVGFFSQYPSELDRREEWKRIEMGTILPLVK